MTGTQTHTMTQVDHNIKKQRRNKDNMNATLTQLKLVVSVVSLYHVPFYRVGPVVVFLSNSCCCVFVAFLLLCSCCVLSHSCCCASVAFLLLCTSCCVMIAFLFWRSCVVCLVHSCSCVPVKYIRIVVLWFPCFCCIAVLVFALSKRAVNHEAKRRHEFMTTEIIKPSP